MTIVAIDRSLTTDEFVERFIGVYLKDVGPQTTEQITRALRWAHATYVGTYCLEALERGELTIVGWDGDEPRFALASTKQV